MQPICLPPFRLDPSGRYKPDPFIAGWGVQRHSESVEKDGKLRQAQLPVVGNRECAQKYKPPPEAAKKDYVTSRNMCAGNVTHGGVDSCQVPRLRYLSLFYDCSRIRSYHPRDVSSSRLYWPFSAGTEFLHDNTYGYIIQPYG